jgi:mono/diheme cytochrome c family protein
MVVLGILLSLLSITFNFRAIIPTLLTALWAEIVYAQEGPANGASSDAAFLKASQVFLHPRCANCHPAGDRPLQMDKGIPHAGRTPVSMPHAEFVGYVTEWVKNGGACPE